jgi:ABC-type sugar transport system ATPase subunit
VIGKNVVQVGDFKVSMETHSATGKNVVAVRPEDLLISTEPEPDATEFMAYAVLPAGADSTIVAKRGKTEITIKVMGISKITMDEKIWLKFNPDALNLYDKESGNLISCNN